MNALLIIFLKKHVLNLKAMSKEKIAITTVLLVPVLIQVVLNIQEQTKMNAKI